MFAIVKTGGKQYRAISNGTLMVEKLEAEPGASVELNEVLMLRDDKGVTIGSPLVTGAKVVATVLRHGKGPKIVGFTYKAKKNVRHRYGHRQPCTYIKVTDIVPGS